MLVTVAAGSAAREAHMVEMEGLRAMGGWVRARGVEVGAVVAARVEGAVGERAAAEMGAEVPGAEGGRAAAEARSEVAAVG